MGCRQAFSLLASGTRSHCISDDNLLPDLFVAMWPEGNATCTAVPQVPSRSLIAPAQMLLRLRRSSDMQASILFRASVCAKVLADQCMLQAASGGSFAQLSRCKLACSQPAISAYA
jgi:hypothetical protein